jgi:nucleoside-diphosphate kinase
MTSGPVLALIVAGTDAIAVLRLLTGPKDHTEAPPGTIRGDFCAFTRKNIVHASDSAESAKREIELFFTPGEIFEWEDGNERWFF